MAGWRRAGETVSGNGEGMGRGRGKWGAGRLAHGEPSHATPALGLGHEMAHATGNRHATAVLSNTPDRRYDTKEERRVIRNYENPAARELGESPRYNHGGVPYNVNCPTCE
jgi:hypothetical protein